jgi:membrane-bound metal-dependent hydrolase YbcI (DUF457 family)
LADFKTHISWGAVLAIILVVAGLLFSIISGIEPLIWIFVAVLIGSFLPDLDLDDGLPFQIVFGLAAASLAGVVFFNFYQSGERDYKTLIGLPILVFVIVRFALGYVFMKFTHHRGIFHSIPAAFLAILVTVRLLSFFEVDQELKWFSGAAVGIGYLGHLILDEIYSTISFGGLMFRPKKSLGSALKFFSKSKVVTVLVYGLILFMYLQVN